MRTLAESFGFKPTKFLPNGCGTGGWLGKLVPDKIGGVDFDTCCDLHDLAYHVGKGGFLGLFWNKVKVDFQLALCMQEQIRLEAQTLFLEGRSWRAWSLAPVAGIAPTVYFLALTLLGWTPLTWPWKQRPMPSHEDLERLLAHNRND